MKAERGFELGKSLELLRTSGEELLYDGSGRAARSAPYLRDGLSLQRYMSMPVLAALPAALGGIYLFGWRTLVVIAVSYLFGGLVQVGFSLVRRRPFSEGLLVTGLLYALLLPPLVPLWLVALGIIIAMLSRELFGGLGQNIFNPALVGKAFLLLIVPTIMAAHWAAPYWGGWGGLLHYMPQKLPALTPLLAAAANQAPPLWQLFVGNVPGALGTTSGLLMLLGGGLLLVTRTIDWRISLVMIVTVGLLEGLLGMMGLPGQFGVGGWATQLLAGSLLFAAFFNATDPVTSPFTRRGRWLYGILTAVLVVLLRGLTGAPEGVTFSILIANAFVPLLDRWTLPQSFAAREEGA
ncbi:MAG TPA: RnfABCDGE type electron transport complex subunit D [Candidatus Fraserbacteria bacterium]|nr:RnfABCDGE type electron transport complex subunit D [Candidatus Fraserbacteria bacterium]